MEEQSNRKVFISYSHTSSDFRNVIIELARRLMTEGGINVVLDAWDLQEGQSVSSFMESMVNDPSIDKVVVFSNGAYAQKANDRTSGVGVEAQIISKEVYDAVGQIKFIPVVMEYRDGKACLPTFFGDRLYVDMSSPQAMINNFEQLVRAIWDKPVHKKPEPGPMPLYLLEEESKSGSPLSALISKVEIQSKNKQIDVSDEIESVFFAATKEFELYRNRDVPGTMDEFIGVLSDSIQFRDDMVKFLDVLVRRKLFPEYEQEWHLLLETAVTFKHPGVRVYQYQDWYHIFVYEYVLYQLATLLRRGEYSAAGRMMRRSYLIHDRQARSRNVGIDACYHYSDTLAAWTNEIGQKYVMPVATLFHDRASNNIIDFPALMEADSLVFIQQMILGKWWFPATLVYHGHGDPPDLFLRAEDQEGMNNLLSILELSSKDNLCSKLSGILETANNTLSKISNWGDLKLNNIIAMEKICGIS